MGLLNISRTSSTHYGRRARVFFYVNGPEMVLLHGFVKKSPKTPEKELKLANTRKKEHERYDTQKD